MVAERAMEIVQSLANGGDPCCGEHSGMKLRTWIADISYRSGDTHLGTYNDVLFGTDQARTAGLFLRRGNTLVAQDMFTGPRSRDVRELDDRRFYRLNAQHRSYNRSRTSVTMDDREGGSRLQFSFDDSFGIVQRHFHYLLNTDFLLHQDKSIEEWESLYFHYDENRFRIHHLYDMRGGW